MHLKKSLGLSKEYEEYKEVEIRERKLQEQKIKLQKSLKEIEKAKKGDKQLMNLSLNQTKFDKAFHKNYTQKTKLIPVK